MKFEQPTDSQRLANLPFWETMGVSQRARRARQKRMESSASADGPDKTRKARDERRSANEKLCDDWHGVDSGLVPTSHVHSVFLHVKPNLTHRRYPALPIRLASNARFVAAPA